jgi:DNA-binding YbaB/EbfC family protein
MFNKLKQFKDLRDSAKEMQNALAGESVTVSSSGVHLTMNGNLELTKVEIDTELLVVDKKSKLQSAIMDAHKDAMKKMQRIMAMKMKEMGGLPNIPGLS